MRRFTLESETGRKIVVIELRGPRMIVAKLQPDGTTKRTEKALNSEVEARSASDQLARELAQRGYKEQVARNEKAAKAEAKAKPASPDGDPDDNGLPYLLAEIEQDASAAEPVLPRTAPQPLVSAAPASADNKKKAKAKKQRKKPKGEEGLDKRVLAAVGVVGLLLLGGLAFIVYDQFIKPPTIVGTWRGSMTEYEIGGPIIHTKYDLILDEKKRASMTLQEKITSTGTYSLKGNLLKMAFKSEEGETNEVEYKISLGRATLDLMDPTSGKLAVQLIRFREPPVVGEAKSSKPAEAPKDLAADVAKIDKAADDAIAAVKCEAKDGFFKLRHPQGWQPETGSRPDNTYSWITLTRDAAKIRVYSDIQGSLMSGAESASPDQPEGSESAPVHVAHELYKKTAAEDFSEYKESKPVVFKGSALGEGRISVFNAAEGGLLGSTLLKGYHATLITRDRRVSILCQCPAKDFGSLKPVFLAVCRSVSR